MNTTNSHSPSTLPSAPTQQATSQIRLRLNTKNEVEVLSPNGLFYPIFWVRAPLVEHEPLAHLLAAAPDLLASTRDLLETLSALSMKHEDGMGNLVGTSIYAARSAIARAEGRTP